jgi:hypothetical protein
VVVLEWAEDRGRRLLLLLRLLDDVLLLLLLLHKHPAAATSASTSGHHHNFCNLHEPDDVWYESNPDGPYNPNNKPNNNPNDNNPNNNPNDKPNSDSAYYRGNCDNHRDRDAIHKHLNSDGQ